MLATSVVLILIFWLWQPMPQMIWQVESQIGQIILYSLYGLGWFIVLYTSFLINHFDLFGLRQVYFEWKQKPYEHLGFMSPGLYKIVRHPLYVGLFIAFWSAPVMTVGPLTVFSWHDSIYLSRCAI